MSIELGSFALRQVLSSTVVLGPLLLLIGVSYFLFKQDRKSVLFYLATGAVFTVVGMACLYSGFHLEPVSAERSQKAAETLAVEPAQK
ncbi:hypothetical protein ACES2L_05640 [Bdellovibrio bacteriovorus]